ncbi:TPA: helix-turn-helix domain-containing protein [Burkholderia vietnamiensis]|uniref:helix-turn-helix domain-containing protein n=1 Tax=Burkholderia vietnamiensis TaxID=60552 RepID=UPI001B9F64F7|nr:helix-turn-helix domain-containing protein [Burkholderia vietnamiensis]MBR7911222.1 helix-turn-helix domain-containing protein [Burkholderia vietnamiensis]HDR9275357.1 helix-turn-helix domain-containing protein [Burkholderia vietnamiensis]
MSVQAMTWAIEQQDIRDATARHVLLCLANYADADGKAAFPSTSRLEADTGLSESTIRRKLDVLEELGLIQKGNQAIVAAYIDRGDRRPVCYDMVMKKRGVVVTPGDERGVTVTGTGCHGDANGVSLTSERGVTVTPNPSLTINKPSKNRSRSCDSKFDEAWQQYPKREGSNSKQAAQRAWNARVREGIDPGVLVAAVAAYAAAMKTAGNIGTPYVKQASTFFGRDRHFEEFAKSQPAGSDLFAGGDAIPWWKAAGFTYQWQATNAGCSERSAHLWANGVRQGAPA